MAKRYQKLIAELIYSEDDSDIQTLDFVHKHAEDGRSTFPLDPTHYIAGYKSVPKWMRPATARFFGLVERAVLSETDGLWRTNKTKPLSNAKLVEEKLSDSDTNADYPGFMYVSPGGPCRKCSNGRKPCYRYGIGKLEIDKDKKFIKGKFVGCWSCTMLKKVSCEGGWDYVYYHYDDNVKRISPSEDPNHSNSFPLSQVHYPEGPNHDRPPDDPLNQLPERLQANLSIIEPTTNAPGPNIESEGDTPLPGHGLNNEFPQNDNIPNEIPEHTSDTGIEGNNQSPGQGLNIEFPQNDNIPNEPPEQTSDTGIEGKPGRGFDDEFPQNIPNQFQEPTFITNPEENNNNDGDYIVTAENPDPVINSPTISESQVQHNTPGNLKRRNTSEISDRKKKRLHHGWKREAAVMTFTEDIEPGDKLSALHSQGYTKTSNGQPVQASSVSHPKGSADVDVILNQRISDDTFWESEAVNHQLRERGYVKMKYAAHLVTGKERDEGLLEKRLHDLPWNKSQDHQFYFHLVHDPSSPDPPPPDYLINPGGFIMAYEPGVTSQARRNNPNLDPNTKWYSLTVRGWPVASGDQNLWTSFPSGITGSPLEHTLHAPGSTTRTIHSSRHFDPNLLVDPAVININCLSYAKVSSNHRKHQMQRASSLGDHHGRIQTLHKNGNPTIFQDVFGYLTHHFHLTKLNPTSNLKQAQSELPVDTPLENMIQWALKQLQTSPGANITEPIPSTSNSKLATGKPGNEKVLEEEDVEVYQMEKSDINIDFTTEDLWSAFNEVRSYWADPKHHKKASRRIPRKIETPLKVIRLGGSSFYQVKEFTLDNYNLRHPFGPLLFRRTVDGERRDWTRKWAAVKETIQTWLDEHQGGDVEQPGMAMFGNAVWDHIDQRPTYNHSLSLNSVKELFSQLAPAKYTENLGKGEIPSGQGGQQRITQTRSSTPSWFDGTTTIMRFIACVVRDVAPTWSEAFGLRIAICGMLLMGDKAFGMNAGLWDSSMVLPPNHYLRKNRSDKAINDTERLTLTDVDLITGCFYTSGHFVSWVIHTHEKDKFYIRIYEPMTYADKDIQTHTASNIQKILTRLISRQLQMDNDQEPVIIAEVFWQSTHPQVGIYQDDGTSCGPISCLVIDTALRHPLALTQPIDFRMAGMGKSTITNAEAEQVRYMIWKCFELNRTLWKDLLLKALNPDHVQAKVLVDEECGWYSDIFK